MRLPSASFESITSNSSPIKYIITEGIARIIGITPSTNAIILNIVAIMFLNEPTWFNLLFSGLISFCSQFKNNSINYPSAKDQWVL